jgi:hypothetical protein
VSDTTFEQARRCPESSCKQPGKSAKESPLPQGGKIHTFECVNERCPRHGERWLVQTNPDGSIPQPHAGGPKTFPKLNHHSTAAIRARQEMAILDFESTHPGMTRLEIIRALGG